MSAKSSRAQLEKHQENFNQLGSPEYKWKKFLQILKTDLQFNKDASRILEIALASIGGNLERKYRNEIKRKNRKLNFLEYTKYIEGLYDTMYGNLDKLKQEYKHNPNRLLAILGKTVMSILFKSVIKYLKKLLIKPQSQREANKISQELSFYETTYSRILSFLDYPS